MKTLTEYQVRSKSGAHMLVVVRTDGQDVTVHTYNHAGNGPNITLDQSGVHDLREALLLAVAALEGE